MFNVVEQSFQLNGFIRCFVRRLCEAEKLTLSPSVVRIDKALGTSKAVFCFFTMWMQETGITTWQEQTQKIYNFTFGGIK